MKFEIIEQPEGTSDLPAEVRRGIREADPPDVGPRDYVPLQVALRDADGALRGGAYGATMWGWLMLDGLWVAAEIRGRGHGARLLAAAESAARRRGCRGVWLGTFDFQARSFYERQGYRIIGELAEFPAGHTHFQLAKRFDDARQEAADSGPIAPNDE
jgi:GNAT superfamily N-acetyltransferase